MITHIVFFKLKDRSPQSIEKARNVLLGLKGRIPQLRHLEVGIDVLHSERSYDIALVTKFNSLEDLVAYQKHPMHVEVAKYMTSVRESAVAVDYESE
ncbi:Stress responsive A/B Barrel Domain protein [uncultured archaeon]|nr:Stress responsive A/B Barrel Domain protein [uncultured archaeon]